MEKQQRRATIYLNLNIPTFYVTRETVSKIMASYAKFETLKSVQKAS